MDDIAQEVRMLKVKRRILRYKHNVYCDALSPVDEARVLQTECELLERDLIRQRLLHSIPRQATANDLGSDTRWFMAGRGGREAYHYWSQNHFANHDELRFDTANASYRCSERYCLHYIYGFPSLEKLREHVEEHYRTPSPASLSIAQDDHLPEIQPATPGNTSNDVDADFVYVSFEPSSAKKRKAQKQPVRRRKAKKGNGGEAIKTSRQKNPCLRCKILKKECDDETPCNQCPKQGINGKGDYWKVLGCLRGDFDSFAKIFVPDSLFGTLGRPTTLIPIDDDQDFWRQVLGQYLALVTKSQDFAPFTQGLGSFPSYYRLEKILKEFRNLERRPLDDVFDFEWLHSVCSSFEIQSINHSSAGLPSLETSIVFQDYDLRLMFGFGSIGHAILFLEQKRASSKQRDSYIYSKNGTETENESRKTCDGYQRLRSSCFFHEEQIVGIKGKSRIDMFNRDAEDRTQRVILHQLLWNLQSDLKVMFLATLRSRKCLNTYGWFETFASLCGFSIVKSLLIDAQTETGDGDDGAQVDAAARAGSAYKVMVSTFAHAASADLLVEWYRARDHPGETTDEEWETFKTLCKLVQRDRWHARGIKSSKDFLMRLGSGFYNDGTYNGFYIQRFGLEVPQPSKDVSPSLTNEDTPRCPNIDPREPSPTSFPFHDDHLVNESVQAYSEIQSDQNAQDVSGILQQHTSEVSSVYDNGLATSANYISDSDTWIASLYGA